MKKITHLIYSFSIAVVASLLTISFSANACSIAGTAAATQDSMCVSGSTVLTLTGYLGNIQWQSFDGTNWVDETGPGSTTDNYTVNLSVTTDFRAVVTEPTCPPDTSNLISITVGVTSPTTTGASRCGYGPVTLSAIGPGIKWYDVPTGGSAIFSGSNFNTNVASTTTFYAAATTGGGPPTPLTTTFAGGNGFDGNMFDIIAINTVTIDSFTANFNPGTETAEIWYRQGTHVGFTGSNAGWTLAGSAVYTSTSNGAPGTPISVFVNVTIPAGQTYAFYVHGNGGITYSNGTAVGNICAFDANIQVTEGFGGAYFNLTNSPRIFNGTIFYAAGCESARTPAVATVNPSDSISISANPPALCQGQTSTINVISNNANYAYTWSPATGLSGTTGTTNTATPNSPTTYVIVGDDGTCGAIDSVFIDVGPASAAGTAAISSDTICLGTDAFLTVAGYTGNIQWQSNDGSGWVDETNTGSTTDNYAVSPPIFTQYRAVVTSGGCDPDTTVTLNLDVITIVDPITVNDTICAPGFAALSASGPGVLNWFTSASGGIPVHTGPGYSPNIAATTTYYVQASAGGIYPTGPVNLGIGTQALLAGNDFGLQFDVVQQCILERVFVSPGGTSGNIIINLRDMLGGPILNTTTVAVTAFSGLVPVPVNFTLTPGTAYRLELGAGSVQLYSNTNGAIYPYTSAGSPVTITGAVNPNYNAGQTYYYFYNWEVKVGCSSNFIPVTGFVNSPPAVPSISQNGTILTSSAPSGNQWYLNGNLIPGATGVNHDMTLTGSGSYTVTVTADGCSSTSQPIVYTSINDLSGAGISVYPNPVSNVLNISMMDLPPGKITLRIYNALGELLQSEVISQNNVHVPWTYPAGAYGVEISTENGKYVTRIVKL